jgi:tripeptide aminopeptidase
MVAIPSESGEEQEFIQFLYDRFLYEFKATCNIDHYGNLIVKMQKKNCSGNEPLLLAMHGDTVKPGVGIEPWLERNCIRPKGNTILGADDKASIAEVMEAIRTASAHPPLEIVITREEEIGLKGAKNLDFAKITAKQGVVMDMEGLNTVVIGGPSCMALDIELFGKAAHAGMEPEKGVSAIRTACKAISSFHEGRIDQETTANVGIFHGGIIRNGVPDYVQIKAECRSLNHEKCLRYGQIISEAFQLASKVAGASADIKTEVTNKAYRISSEAEIVQVACRAIQSVGLIPETKVIGGGTDAAILNEHGILTIAMGNGGFKEHSYEEYISTQDMETAVYVLLDMFQQMISSSIAKG